MKKKGKATPLDVMPYLDYSYEWYYMAFSLLRSSRNENGIIPLSEILTYTEHFEIISSKVEFITIIQGLDIAENDYHSSRRKAESDKKKK